MLKFNISVSTLPEYVCEETFPLLNSLGEDDFIIFPLEFSAKAKNQYPVAKFDLLKIAVVFPDVITTSSGLMETISLLKGGIK